MENLRQLWQHVEEAHRIGDIARAHALLGRILAADPSQAYALHELSRIELGMGNFIKAHHHVMQAARVVVTHRRWRALPYVAMQLLRLDEIERLVDMIDHADTTDAAVVSQMPVLAQCLWAAGDYDGSLAMVDAASTIAPHHPQLLFLRGNIMRHLGRFTEATDAFEECIGRAPGFADAHWMLASHAPTGSASRIVRIGHALRQHASESEAAVCLHYAMFKELDHAGQRERAWEALNAGMSAKRARLGFNAVREASVLACLVKEMEELARLAPRKAGDLDDGAVPVFIVGMPRTGTTLLERMLGNHRGVVSIGESNAFRLGSAHASGRLQHAFPMLEDIACRKSANATMLAQHYLSVSRRRAGGSATHVVDKNPENLHLASWILHVLPRARILCMERDPMDACFSNLKEWFSEDNYAYSYNQSDVALHHRGVSRMMNRLARLHPERFMKVGYESLAQEPERTLQAVAAFCGLEYDPESTDLRRNKSPAATASSSHVRDAVVTHRIGGWRPYGSHLGELQKAVAGGGEGC